TMSGQQWGAWNATYGPRGADGRPVPLWDAKTGKINRSVVDHWKKYDLRLQLAQNWKQLAPRLRGKLHIWVGEADDYFLNNAVHLLDAFLATAEPPYEGRITYGLCQGHGWTPINEAESMKKPATVKRSFKELLVEHGLDVLLIFIPAAVILHYTHAAEFWVFIASGLAIVPLAGWMGKATEALAEKLGAGIGGLLNATF